MALVSDSSSSFTSVPSDGSTFSQHNANNGGVTPTKSLTPRYAAVHCNSGGAAAAYLQQQRMVQQRREPRHRFVEGGAPAERYLEPLPYHQPPLHHAGPPSFHHHHSTNGTAGGALNAVGSPHVSGRSLNSLPPGSSPNYRQLAAAAVASPTSSSSPVGLAVPPTAHPNPNTTAGASSGMLSALPTNALNSDSCMSLKPLQLSGGSSGERGAHAPLQGGMAVDGKGVPSPLVPSLGPSSPQLPRPPSIAGACSGERVPFLRRMGSSSVSPQRMPMPPVPFDDHVAAVSSDDPDDDHQLSTILGNYCMQRVDSVLLPRSNSGYGGGPHAANFSASSAAMAPSVSPPQPMCSFRREHAGDEDDNESAGSGSVAHGSPYSSFRLDGSQYEVPSPRVGSTSTMMAIDTRNVSPGALGFSNSNNPMNANTNTERDLSGLPPTSPARTPTASPRSTFLALGGARPAEPLTVTEGWVRFTFMPRDGACTVDSLEEGE